MMTSPMRRVADLKTDSEFFALLTGTYARLVGAHLVPEGKNADWLYAKAPFAVVAHDTEADPKFMYANTAAQKCFEFSWEEMIGLPSRLSAEAPERAARQALLDAVAQKGFMSGYSGIRVAKSGRRFLIENGIVWQLTGQDGLVHGQAATFPSWRNL